MTGGICRRNQSRLVCGLVLAAVMVGMSDAGAVENPGDVRDCSDFATSNEANTWFWTYFPEHGDVANLDPDDDTVPCESLPAFASVSPYVDIDLSAGQDVAVASGETEDGLWLTREDGTVEIRGSAIHYGDRPTLETGERVTALAATPPGDGYWLFTNRGNAFAYGTAIFYGDFGHLNLDGEIIDAVPTSDGTGYYMIGSDGGIFTAGSAVFYGSIPQILPGVTLDGPVVGMSVTPGGYILVAADGGTFTFGLAVWYGSIPQILPGVPLLSPIIALVPGPAGYLMLGGDGGVFNFGTSEFHGSLSGIATSDVIAVAVKTDLSGYLILDADGTVWALGDTRHIGVKRFTGTGDIVLNVPIPDEAVIYAAHAGASDFSILARDDLDNGLELLVNEIGAFGGFMYLDQTDTAKLEIVADDAWVIEIAPISYAAHWRTDTGASSGSGHDVVRATRPAPGSTFVTNSTTAGDTVIRAHEMIGADVELLVEKTGNLVDSQVPFPNWAGHTLLQIETSGTWNIAIS